MPDTKHGINAEKFDSLMTKQNGCCALCYQELKKNTACVDRNHVTGEVRGLLCQPCNRGLGCFRDSPDILARALSYLDPNWCGIKFGQTPKFSPNKNYLELPEKHVDIQPKKLPDAIGPTPPTPVRIVPPGLPPPIYSSGDDHPDVVKPTTTSSPILPSTVRS